jgi:integrase
VILGLYTGQRLKDCIEMTKDDVIIPVVKVKQCKTGNLVEVHAIGQLLELAQRRKEATDQSDRLLVRDDGQAYTERLFSEHLRKFLDSVGFGDISFHGLRYAAAGTLNEAGATVATIVSILGHSTYAMAIKYLEARENQKRAAVLTAQADERRSHGNATTGPP